MFSMLTLCIKHIPYINQDLEILYIWWSITSFFFQFTYFWSLVICHLWYRFSIDTEVLHSGIVPKPKLWYRAILNIYLHEYYQDICLWKWINTDLAIHLHWYIITSFCLDWRSTKERGKHNTWHYVLLWMVIFWEWVCHNFNVHF